MKLKQVEEYLEKWPKWISLIFMILPGLIYQINVMNVSLSLYQGILVFVLLISSIYYSIPFAFMGFIFFIFLKICQTGKITPDKETEKINLFDFFSISISSIFFFSIIYVFVNIYGTKSLFWMYTLSIFFLVTLFIPSAIIIQFFIKKINKTKNDNRKR